MSGNGKLGRYHAAVWDEPVVMDLGHPGRRGQIFPAADPRIAKAVGEAKSLIPSSMRRPMAPALPELSEPEVVQHRSDAPADEPLNLLGPPSKLGALARSPCSRRARKHSVFGGEPAASLALEEWRHAFFDRGRA